MASSGHTIEDLYRGVITDVISQVREAFLDDNIDFDVLQQLKKSWEAKVNESDAVSLEPKNIPPPAIRQRQPMVSHPHVQMTGILNEFDQQSEPQISIAPSKPIKPQLHISSNPPQQQQMIYRPLPISINQRNVLAQNLPGSSHQINSQLANPHSNQQFLSALPTGLLPGQLISLQAGASNSHSQTVQFFPMTHNQQSQPNLLIVTDNSHQSNMQHGETSTSQHNYNASQATRIRTTAIKTEPYIHQLDGQISIGAGHSERKDIRKKPERSAGKKSSSTSIKQLIEKIRVIPQLDGGPGMTDTSSESEIDDDEDPLNRFASFEGNEKTECDEVAEEDEPLNSGDDQSDDEDLETLFEAENIVVCQFEKVHRARNKWKFILKDGIMHINGKDYCFQKGMGEAEW